MGQYDNDMYTRTVDPRRKVAVITKRCRVLIDEENVMVTKDVFVGEDALTPQELAELGAVKKAVSKPKPLPKTVPPAQDPELEFGPPDSEEVALED